MLQLHVHTTQNKTKKNNAGRRKKKKKSCSHDWVGEVLRDKIKGCTQRSEGGGGGVGGEGRAVDRDEELSSRICL